MNDKQAENRNSGMLYVRVYSPECSPNECKKQNTIARNSRYSILSHSLLINDP